MLCLPDLRGRPVEHADGHPLPAVTWLQVISQLVGQHHLSKELGHLSRKMNVEVEVVAVSEFCRSFVVKAQRQGLK